MQQSVVPFFAVHIAVCVKPPNERLPVPGSFQGCRIPRYIARYLPVITATALLVVSSFSTTSSTPTGYTTAVSYVLLYKLDRVNNAYDNR